ncbi:hypothetical protein Emin_0227 [Elusimicrobium minutum Pei191]|uniref:Uncharacterized protein n=1 Tax=Elusimicrobium minutum (strain Pei191) TaxID=445932 RepID=B2KB30_ELUMP|nr:hypothetical protein [Elusimicrobium minutum]ACC97789.1 hypothetical protein Emin_0227 [Elusimicrobium minutum Pei191]
MAKQKEEIGVFKKVAVFPRRIIKHVGKYYPFDPDNPSGSLWEMELYLALLIVSKDNLYPYLSFPYDLLMRDFKRYLYHMLATRLLSVTVATQFVAKTYAELEKYKKEGGPTEKIVHIWYKDKYYFMDFLDRYLRAYEKGVFDGEYNSKNYSTKLSLRATVNLLKAYSKVHGSKFTLRPEWEDIDGKLLKVDPRSRVMTDLLLLENKRLISISRVSADDFEEWCKPRIVMVKDMKIRANIELLKPIEEIEKEIFEVKAEKGFLGLVVNEENEVFYNGTKIKAFSSSAEQQIGLLKLLISKKGVAATREAVYSALGYTMKSKKAPKRHNEYDDGYDEIEGTYKRGPKINKREAFRDRLKKLIKEVQSKLPDGSVIIKNTEKEGVFIVSGETKVSHK